MPLLRKRIRLHESDGRGTTLLDGHCAAFQSAAEDRGVRSGVLAAFREAFPDSRWESALPALDDAYSVALPDADRARLWCDVAGVLRERFRVHPLELADVVLCLAVAAKEPTAAEVRRADFGGFCTDSFRVPSANWRRRTRRTG